MTTPSKAEAGPDLLTPATIRLGIAAADRRDAIEQAGQLLVDAGAVEPAYVEAMHEREQVMSSFMGEGFALPHGTDESRRHVNRAAVAFVQFDAPVIWDDDDEQALAALAVAATSDEHVGILATLARVLVDEDKAERLRTTEDVDEVLELLAPAIEEESE
jgi:PTS system mannitol-specific IIC component